MEQVRGLIMRDFRAFGVGALLVFTLALVLLYRSLWIVVGTLVAAGTALTLLVRQAVGLEVDLLTPNITTIVFILTLLHIVFLTNNWEVASGEEDPVRTGIRWTRPASFWAMMTTGAGFLSLLLAPVEPARNFGISCAAGAVLAFLSAYLLFPAFLRSTEPGRGSWAGLERALGGERLKRHCAVAATRSRWRSWRSRASSA